MPTLPWRSAVRHAGKSAPSDVNNVADVVTVIFGVAASSMPHRYPTGVTSLPKLLPEAVEHLGPAQPSAAHEPGPRQQSSLGVDERAVD